MKLYTVTKPLILNFLDGNEQIGIWAPVGTLIGRTEDGRIFLLKETIDTCNIIEACLEQGTITPTITP